MGFFEYVLEHFDMLFELIGLLIILRLSVHISEGKKHLTIAVVLLLLFASVIFRLEVWTQSFLEYTPLRPFFTACNYSVYPVILLLLLQITADRLFTRKQLLLLLIPEFLSVPLYFTSPWTHLVCWFSEDNHFMRGPLSYLPYVIFGVYLLVFLVYNAMFFKDYSSATRYTIAYIILMPVVGALYYLLFLEYNDYSALFTSAILLYYIFLYIHMARIEPLTKLLNRQSYYEDQKLNAKTISGVVSVDMNDLKYYNDSFGHQAGDTALVAIAEILRTRCGQNGTVYRIGGDEFVIFYTRTGESEMIAAIDDMRAALAQTPYACSFGYALKTPEKTMHDTLTEADRCMYADKQTLKKNTRTDGAT